MNKLNEKVIKTFLLSLFLVYLLITLTDDTIYIFLRKVPEGSLKFWTLGISSLVLDLVIVALISVFFIKKTGKYFDTEIKRQLDEQHLLYSSIAHDIKTPLTSVKGYSKALLDGKVKPEDLEKTHRTIYRKTDEMTTLLNALFEYSKLSNENYQPQKAETNVSELVKESVINIYNLIEQNDINLEMSIEEDLMAEVAPDEMRRVFDNLILNAISHNEKGINMEVKLIKSHGGLTFYVADSGAPILPEDQKRIFDPFSKLDDSRSKTGSSGLGLAIVQRIVEYHKGAVKVSENIPGYTKAFIVEISQ